MFKVLNEAGACQELIQNKYPHPKTLAQVKLNAYDSPFLERVVESEG
jgi:hypothetical protein